jgi:hypothetical protein
MSGAIIAAMAAAKKKRDEEEENKLATYNSDDLKGWEFKIMRSNFGRFGNPDYLRKVIEQEAQAGWEMVEKFDNERVRFKRRVEKRSNDSYLEFDAYRTSPGRAGTKVPLIITITALAIGAVILGLFILIQTDVDFGSIDVGPVFLILLLLAVVAITLALRKR